MTGNEFWHFWNVETPNLCCYAFRCAARKLDVFETILSFLNVSHKEKEVQESATVALPLAQVSKVLFLLSAVKQLSNPLRGETFPPNPPLQGEPGRAEQPAGRGRAPPGHLHRGTRLYPSAPGAPGARAGGRWVTSLADPAGRLCLLLLTDSRGVGGRPRAGESFTLRTQPPWPYTGAKVAQPVPTWQLVNAARLFLRKKMGINV